MNPSDPPFAFAPPRIYVLKDNLADPRAARRVERVAASCPSAEVLTFTYAELPAIVIEEKFDCRPRMCSLAQAPPPIPILGRFRFDRQAVAEDERRMVQAYRAAGGSGGFNFHLAAGGGAGGVPGTRSLKSVLSQNLWASRLIGKLSAMVCHHLQVVANNNRHLDKLPAPPVPSARGKEQQDQVRTHEFWDNTLKSNPWTDARASRTWDGRIVVREDKTMVTE